MNPTCEKCGARCCKTLIQNVDGFAAGPLELIMTRGVARSRYPVHGAACQATREHVPQ